MLKLIQDNSVAKTIENLCFKNRKDTCLEKKSYLKQDIVILDSEDMTEYISYEKWVTNKIPILVKKVEKLSF